MASTTSVSVIGSGNSVLKTSSIRDSSSLRGEFWSPEAQDSHIEIDPNSNHIFDWHRVRMFAQRSSIYVLLWGLITYQYDFV